MGNVTGKARGVVDKEQEKFKTSSKNSSSRENLYNAVTSTADDPSSILAPDDSAHALSAHQSMAGELLGAASFL